MKKAVLVDIISYFFILLFLYSGIAKLLEVHLFKEQLVSSPFLGSVSGLMTWALPIGEFLLAIGLFITSFRLKALYARLALMSLFTVYVVVIFFWSQSSVLQLRRHYRRIVAKRAYALEQRVCHLGHDTNRRGKTPGTLVTI